MRPVASLTGAAFAVVLALPGAGGANAPVEAPPGRSATEPRCVTCAAARATHGWCDVCDVGYLGDVAIRSRYLWEVLDAHGHDLNVDNLGCAGCTAAARSDGYCAESRIGFVDGQAYFSRLTWLLARSAPQELDAIECPVCRRNVATSGWCERCNVGRIGARVLDQRGDFDDLVHDLEILKLANHAAARCEHCAAAIVTDTECPFCRIRYLDGRPVTKDPITADPPPRTPR